MDDTTTNRITVTLTGILVVDACFAPMLLDMMATAEKFHEHGYGDNTSISITPLTPQAGIRIESLPNSLYQIGKMAGKPE